MTQELDPAVRRALQKIANLDPADGLSFDGSELSEPMSFDGSELDTVDGDRVSMGAEHVTGSAGADPMDNVLSLAGGARPLSRSEATLDIKQPTPVLDAGRPAMPEQQPREAPFDLNRWLTAFGKGDVGAYDARKRYQDEAPQRQQQAAEAREERKARLQELLEGSKHRRAMDMERLRALLEGSRARQEMEQKRLDQRQADIDADNARADDLAKAKTRPRVSKGGGATVKLKMPDGKTVEHFNQRTVALREIDDMLKLLPGVRYTGYGAETANTVMSKLPGGMDMRNDAERKFVSLLGKLRAKERKEIYGAALSRYDISDAGTWLANIGTNKDTIKTNLETLRQALQETQDETRRNYPKLSGDAIGESKAATGEVGGGEESPPTKPGSQPGEKQRNKRTGTVWTWDGSKWGR